LHDTITENTGTRDGYGSQQGWPQSGKNDKNEELPHGIITTANEGRAAAGQVESEAEQLQQFHSVLRDCNLPL